MRVESVVLTVSLLVLAGCAADQASGTNIGDDVIVDYDGADRWSVFECVEHAVAELGTADGTSVTRVDEITVVEMAPDGDRRQLEISGRFRQDSAESVNWTCTATVWAGSTNIKAVEASDR